MEGRSGYRTRKYRDAARRPHSAVEILARGLNHPSACVCVCVFFVFVCVCVFARVYAWKGIPHRRGGNRINVSQQRKRAHSGTNRVVLKFARLYYGSREITESLTCTTGDAIKLSVGYFSPSRIISRLELIRGKDGCARVEEYALARGNAIF